MSSGVNNDRFVIKSYIEMLKYTEDRGKREELLITIEKLIEEYTNTPEPYADILKVLNEIPSDQKFRVKDIFERAMRLGVYLPYTHRDMGFVLASYSFCRYCAENGLLIKKIKNGTAGLQYRLFKTEVSQC